MKSIAFFNNKGGVGKTSLIYHLAWMYADLGRRVLLADLDPQSNLTAMCFNDETIERIYEADKTDTIYSAIEPVKRGAGDLRLFDPLAVTAGVAILPGDLMLSNYEDDLSAAWPRCLDGDERAFRITCAFHRVIEDSAMRHGADLALIDIGPSFGALSRAALIAAEFVVTPVTPDLFSFRGLMNVGQRLRSWREEWRERLSSAPALEFAPPSSAMTPIGIVVSLHSEHAGAATRAAQTAGIDWQAVYRAFLDNPRIPDSKFLLGRIKDYRSLVGLAREVHKPVFRLRPGDGAIGGLQGAVAAAYSDFETLARNIAARIDIEL
jgi:cellulose biosynthesis protein BcsQ